MHSDPTHAIMSLSEIRESAFPMAKRIAKLVIKATKDYEITNDNLEEMQKLISDTEEFFKGVEGNLETYYKRYLKINGRKIKENLILIHSEDHIYNKT